MTISGSIVLHATSAVERLMLNIHEDCNLTLSKHLNTQLNGAWFMWDNLVKKSSIFIPVRNKELTVYSTNTEVLNDIELHLKTLDSNDLGFRQLHKLQLLMQKVNYNQHNYAATIIDTGAKDTFSLISQGMPIHMCLVIDTKTKSVQLVWSTLDIKTLINNQYPLRYFFYVLPTIYNRPVFIHVQALTANWWKWNKSLANCSDGMLKCCNILEMRLFKDPSLANL